MDKIKLIKSFAWLPIGEYELKWDDYVSTDLFYLDGMSWYPRIHKDIVEWMKDHFEEVKERPTSWEDIELIGNKMLGYWVTDDCSVQEKYWYWRDKKVFKTEEQAEASIALAQVTQLLDKYDIPEYSNIWYWKESNNIIWNWDAYKTKRKWLLYFDTQEKLEHFYKHHKTLIDKLAPFYIF